MAEPDAARKLRESLRSFALDELGFTQCGFAPPDPPLHADAYLAWLERGWHGEMAYMAREDAVRRRLSPAEALPGCRSLIVLSLAYPGGDGDGAAGGGVDGQVTADGDTAEPSTAIVARYARGRDYHDVFEERLAGLAERVAAVAPESRSKPYVDYGPVLERDHAQRAGLGWIGKNTLLIHPRLGSYLLLGELLTTLDLPPDEPFTADRCGTCTRCIDACPTDAIEDGRLLDARRCISYLTIELRGPIPLELRPLIGSRVFGCDICQEVCPWNADPGESDPARPQDWPGVRAERPPAGRTSPLALPHGRPAPPAALVAWASELLALDAEGFRERYRGTALSRPGRDGLLRNLCVGLGNAAAAGEGGPPGEGGPYGAEAVLRRAAADGSALVREHAEWALGRLARVRYPAR